MPVHRTESSTISTKYASSSKRDPQDTIELDAEMSSKFFKSVNTPEIAVAIMDQDPPLQLENAIRYPSTAEQRDAFRTKAGKRLTPHQWAVYDFALTIPKGKVTTYKEVALAAGGSARSVGSALRNNPFAPYVPCHRVIASNMFIGGFFGEWGKEHKTGTRCNQKIQMLAQEGVHFNDSGHLLSANKYLWRSAL